MLLLLSVGNALTGGFQLSAQVQSKSFSVKVDNITLKEAIEVIKKQGNYSFLIRNNDIDLNRKVSVNINNGTINDVMGQLLAGTDVRYEVNGNRVIMFHAVTPQKEQEKAFVLKGRITDPTGEGVIGANVKVVDSTEGTITDMDGNFSLMVTPNARLSISYIGYATQEVVVKDQRPLNVTLKEDTRLIDEVVVVGYGVQKKANLTGAVSSVKMDDVLGDRPVVSVSDALKGAMPGLQITGNSGRPGEEMSFNIRGVNSLDKNGKPLVLVDNVEMDINMLDPNDIESVTVLKDAASSAIYGARAAFGVILITTKKGSDATKLSINYSNNFSFSRPANMPHKATPLQTVQAYKDMLVWLDTGLVNYAAQVQKEVLGAKDIMDAWRGMIAEQIVAQELLTLTDKVSQKRCFWVRNKSGSNAEVDYVWVQDSMVYPIEVKSGHNAHLRSLHSFMNRSVQTVAVRIWSQPYAVDEVKTADGKEFKLINLPFYLVGKLDSILRRF